ncbi:MAG: anthranilate synthase component I family protein [Saprospiraceae bacterium]|nr:anthranilate synthase component I family protein [Saprospiraceae bacterium]
MINVKINSIKILSDLTTPVSLFLKLREHFPEILLLESSDYSSKEDSQSFICFDPLLTLEYIKSDYIFKNHRLGSIQTGYEENSIPAINKLLSGITSGDDTSVKRFNGIFGYTTFDMVQDFEDLQFDTGKQGYGIPGLRYDFYRYIIAFDHFYEELYLIENQPVDEDSGLDSILSIISRQDHQTYQFSTIGHEEPNMTDQNYLNMVHKAKANCQRGDVFQIVLSRRFSQEFIGDEFNVYRALRSVNPSPYLFYYDYSDYKIFGSSPEAQMIVHDGSAEIHAIAGTFRRTGDYNKDQLLALQLMEDPKENAEHIMLVDLARNDLSKHCKEVKVASYKEVQFFSHVIHLVSKILGKVNKGISGYQIFADTFPAGTLSGAPKYRALQLIDEYEPTTRSFYGGGLGMINLNGDLNHAIIIRSFLSINGNLHYQAGAGIVIDSIAESELQEVNNKLAALKTAMMKAEKI